MNQRFLVRGLFTLALSACALSPTAFAQEGKAATAQTSQGCSSGGCDGCCASSVIFDSIFRHPSCAPCWTPLTCGTPFSEGWGQAWIAPPNGSSGAPRQGWLNTFEGHFTREFHLGYAHINNTPDGDAHIGVFQLQTPLSRRLWIGVDVPVVGLDPNVGDSRTDFGDVVITPKVMLHETQDLSVSGALGIRTPTGETRTGGDVSSLFPHVQFWSDLGSAVTFRGGAGVNFRTDSGRPDSEFVLSLGIGQTITPHDATPFGDFAYYLATNLRTTLDGPDSTFVSLTPAVRMHLGNNLFLLTGVEIPVTGPRPFDHQFLLVLVQGF